MSKWVSVILLIEMVILFMFPFLHMHQDTQVLLILMSQTVDKFLFREHLEFTTLVRNNGERTRSLCSWCTASCGGAHGVEVYQAYGRAAGGKALPGQVTYVENYGTQQDPYSAHTSYYTTTTTTTAPATTISAYPNQQGHYTTTTTQSSQQYDYGH